MRANRVRPARQHRARNPVLKGGLMLQRQVGDKIFIGDEIEITLMSTEGPNAEIHVAVPRNMQIDRSRPRQR